MMKETIVDRNQVMEETRGLAKSLAETLLSEEERKAVESSVTFDPFVEESKDP
jgi:hypothetical protein